MAKNFTTREENYSQWYNELVLKADLAENSAVRGCMVIKPYGYSVWEKMQAALDKMFKDTGHSNAYFPIFIPKRITTSHRLSATSSRRLPQSRSLNNNSIHARTSKQKSTDRRR
jgi:prolyl-tRNA synthetase